MSSAGHDQSIPAQPNSPTEKAAPAPAPAPAVPRAPQPQAAVGYSAPMSSSSRWQPGPATFGYVFCIFVLFALSVTQMGLSGRQLNKYGYHLGGWDGHHQLKSIIGLILFNAILGLIFSLASFWLPALVAIVSLFVIQSFWIVCAGVMNHAQPYRPGDCDRRPSFDHARFDSSCHQFAALEVISWWLWLWCLLLVVMFAVHWMRGSGENHRKQTVFGA